MKKNLYSICYVVVCVAYVILYVGFYNQKNKIEDIAACLESFGERRYSIIKWQEIEKRTGCLCLGDFCKNCSSTKMINFAYLLDGEVKETSMPVETADEDSANVHFRKNKDEYAVTREYPELFYGKCYKNTQWELYLNK